jgi:hypothetical protein
MVKSSGGASRHVVCVFFGPNKPTIRPVFERTDQVKTKQEEQQVTATKEDAARALEAIREWKGNGASKTVVMEFILAAQKRLPTREAVQRDAQRKRAKTS